MPREATVSVLGEYGDRWFMDYNGTRGYILKIYLMKKANYTAATPAIKLTSWTPKARLSRKSPNRKKSKKALAFTVAL